METLTSIGYWRNDEYPELPNPADLVDPEWDEDKRMAVSGYLASGTIRTAWMG